MLILIAGITGMVGQTLARYALDEGYEVRGLSRNPNKLDAGIGAKLESFISCPDFLDKSYLAQAVKGVDIVIAALPPVPSIIGAGQLVLLIEAEKAGVKIFHAASWNYDWTKINMGDHETYDAYISFKRLAELSCNLKPIYGFTGAILDYMLVHIKEADRPALINKDTRSVAYFGTGNEKLSFTTLDDLAKYILVAINDQEVIKKGTYYVESSHCTMPELADIYGKVRGFEVKKQCYGGKAELEAMLNNARKTIGVLEANRYIDMAYGMLFLNDKAVVDPVDGKRWADKVTPTSVEQWLRDHPEA
ncbi:Isoflavone reductase like protein [Fusarium austroafricanum]|uniref:Isoflavone reductase like protein n=1 Tax=Fusarium austroafricanum TaxID=2364996 RepID=A0A8H4P6N6_9HYPO|nr:Isoflavone reductase like protein [Fusarium austroafricanum]